MHFNLKTLIKFSKKIIIILITISFFPINSIGAEIGDFNKDPFCDDLNPELFINQKNTKKISIETNNPRTWSTNIFELFVDLNSNKYRTDQTGWYTFLINEKFKKKFKSKIKFFFENPSYDCISKGRISVRGDLWWHLDWKNGIPYTSLRVDLKNGHINNLVKFNLLLPKSRQSLKKPDINLELFVTLLFDRVGLLAPKTRLIKAELNGKESDYLFQEMLTKEFLENRNLVEGPILEGDQRFTAEQALDWRGDLGLARIINTSYSIKKRYNSDLSFYSLSVLNSIFIDSTPNKKIQNLWDYRCVHNYLTIDLKKYFKNKEEITKNQIYESFIFATETDHSLTCDDRKFYFEPIKKIFLPIYNDGKSTMDYNDFDIYNKIKKLDITLNSVKGAKDSLDLINKIDLDSFYDELLNNGFTHNKEIFNKLIIKVKKNLSALKALDKIENSELKNKFISIPNYFNDVDPKLKGKEVKLVFINDNNVLEICDLKIQNCISEKIAIKDKNIIFKSVLGQNFSKLKNKSISIFDEKYYYLFLNTSKDYSSNLDLVSENKENTFIQKDIDNSFKIEFTKSTIVNVNKGLKTIKIKFLDINSRAKVIGELVDSWNFEIEGEDFFKSNKEINTASNLTGCLTFVDLNLKNVNIKSNYSICEDAFNFIRTKGNIINAEIKNSTSDGVDLDFSDIAIQNLIIEDSKNDCIDMSFGNYEILNARILNCGDKGVSVGEKSTVNLKDINIDNVDIGVASKDSSKVYIENSIIDANICFAAYRKKQEFSGSILKYNNTNCQNDKFVSQIGSLIIKK